MVLHTLHNATPHESRMRHGEENSVQALLQEIPPKVELGAAHQENSPQTIQTRSTERHKGPS